MRLLQGLPDMELIALFHRGQEKAFDVLFYRYKEDVRRVIVRCVKDRQVTEDLSQDAFIRIYSSLKNKKYNEQGKFKPWALRIVHNLCLDYLRKMATLPVCQEVGQEDCTRVVAHCDVEKKLMTKQQQLHLRCFINCLPDDQKKVVCYRYYEELSFKEIAVLMNTSINTSLGRMRYGLAHLKKQVTDTASFLWQ